MQNEIFHFGARLGSQTFGAMDAQRALLDELMGLNRNGDKPNAEISDFRDQKVCKKYLCGLCPHDLFQNTKMDMGDCSYSHLPHLKTKYEQERKERDYGYEADLVRDLTRFISDVEKKIHRAQKRLEEKVGPGGAAPLLDIENNQEVLEITAEIQSTMEKAEEAGMDGEVDLSMELMHQVEELKKKKASIQAAQMLAQTNAQLAESMDPANYKKMQDKQPSDAPRNPLAGTNVNQKLRVCDVCGAFLSIFDSDRRLADHFGGKLHLGYLQIRKKIAEIEELLAKDKEGKQQQQTNSSGGSTTSMSTKDDRRNYDRKYSRSRDRSRGGDRRDRHRRSRSRGHGRYGNQRRRSYSKGRSCSRSRSRSSERRRR